MIPALDILDGVSLAPRTTLELGGPARFYLRATDDGMVRQGLHWARLRGLRVGILGGGSNLVVGDAGFDGLVIEMAQRGIEERIDGDRVLLSAAAGEDWDLFVERAVASDLGGLECLSGIPGRVGATPIQNVGAYGQEVGESLHSVRVIDRESLETRVMTPGECELGYRDSFFKRNPDRYVVLGVTFALIESAKPAVRYAELARAIRGTPSLADVRDTILSLRRKKSMVIEPDDPNRRSAGSFFTNPIVFAERADAIVDDALKSGLVAAPEDVPRWPAEPASDGSARVKLAAGWLIERAGIQKGMRAGRVGISSRHALALVHHGDGSTQELLALADRVVRAVHARFGVELVPEPTIWSVAAGGGD